MSTIYGLCHYHQKPVTRDDLQVMTQALDHWQPDSKGVWFAGTVGLGHLMLYNTSESLTDKQPRNDSFNNLTITADIRLDNRDEIYPLVNITTSQQKEITDSALVLLLYQKYGPNCMRYLIGDFAFAIWDAQTQQLFCARDHMGVKPFFYYRDDTLFAFASEKKGILAISSVNQSIDEQFLYNQMIFPPEQRNDTTLYRHIKRLPPAYTLLVDVRNKRTQLNCYWTFDAYAENKLGNKNDYYDGLRHHFETAVQCRARSAYPVGAELSGGLDSSAIVGVAQTFLKQQGSQLTTFSNIFPPGVIDEVLAQYDEKRYIDSVIAFNNIQQAVFVDKKLFNDPLEEIDFVLKVNDGLEKWNPLWQLPSKQAAMERGVRTLFSGFPGDQMVTGYPKAYFLDLLDQRQYLRYFLAAAKHKKGLQKFRVFVPQNIIHLLASLKIKAGFYSQAVKKASAWYHIPKQNLLNNMQMHLDDPNAKDALKSYRHMQKKTLSNTLVSLRMESETRFGIYFRMEPRFPMADIRLTQFYSAMPNHLKYEGIERDAFRQAAKNHLPPAIQQRADKAGSVAAFLIADIENNNRCVETLLKRMPNNPLLNKEAIFSIIDSLKKYPDTTDSLINKHRLENLLPSLDILRWLEQSTCL